MTNEVRYVYDGMLVVQERHFQPQVSTSIPINSISYTRGRDLSGSLQGAGGIGGLLARTDHSTLNLQPSTAHAYYHADGNGNITALVNTNGAVVARYQYDPYGNLLGLAGPLAEANTYRFSSKEWHANAGLYYYGYRYYEPNLQRWPNRDPIGEWGGINLHGFVFNNPGNLVDQDGRILPAIIIGAIIYFGYTAIANAPGEQDEAAPPYRDAPHPIEVATVAICPAGALGGAVIFTASESLGVPPEATAAVSMMTPGGPFKNGREAFNRLPEFRRWFHKYWKPKNKTSSKERHNPDADLDEAWEDWCSGGGRNVK